VRNCVAVGADPRRIALLDNFCWPDVTREEALGSLVRAAIACHDVALALGTPFISGKDSLNNEFRYEAPDGTRAALAVPPSLLISALGQVPDTARCVTMDLKQAGSFLYQVGPTRDELGGSHFALVAGLAGGFVPKVDAAAACRTFLALHEAIRSGLVRACHDLSEGGLAAAAAEMAFAGGLGARIELGRAAPLLDAEPGGGPPEKAALMTCDADRLDAILLFSESNSRFLCEVRPEDAAAFEAALHKVPLARLGVVVTEPRLEMLSGARPLISAPLAELKEAWKGCLNPVH
jgi:phosphoribosylformylglycinamidine synthase